MIEPSPLQAGDQILLVSPAGKIEQEQLLPAIRLYESWGLDVKISAHATASYFRFAGTDAQRLSDLQLALDDANIKAIICTRGGYGTVRLLEHLDFSKFKEKPKWLVGFSDITLLHAYFNSIIKCESLHAMMPINLTEDVHNTAATLSLKQALFGERLRYRVGNHPLNVYGKARGELVGGNLSVFTSLLETGLSYRTKGKILFIEDIGEPIHKIERMLYNLKLSGKLGNLKGLLVGAFTEIEDRDSIKRDLDQLIFDLVKEYHYPIVFGFPAGHIKENYTLCFGKKVIMKVVKDGAVITYQKKKKSPKKDGNA